MRAGDSDDSGSKPRKVSTSTVTSLGPIVLETEEVM
jgi:hypothetical protein